MKFWILIGLFLKYWCRLSVSECTMCVCIGAYTTMYLYTRLRSWMEDRQILGISAWSRLFMLFVSYSLRWQILFVRLRLPRYTLKAFKLNFICRWFIVVVKITMFCFSCSFLFSLIHSSFYWVSSYVSSYFLLLYYISIILYVNHMCF